jgi:hypothetical protein
LGVYAVFHEFSDGLQGIPLRHGDDLDGITLIADPQAPPLDGLGLTGFGAATFGGPSGSWVGLERWA